MIPRLPETFKLPTGNDYDEAITTLDEKVQGEGSARLYLGAVRYERRGSEAFTLGVLRDMARHALILEEKNERGALVDPGHHLANTALSGMIFGHLINEFTYPNSSYPYKQYARILVDVKLLGEASLDIKPGEPIDRLEDLRAGYGMMAEYCLQQLGESSKRALINWANEASLNDGLRKNFVYGAGLAMYGAWDRYRDLLTAEGREDEVVLFDPENSDDTNTH